MEGKRTKESEGPLIMGPQKLGEDFKFTGKPSFVKSR